MGQQDANSKDDAGHVVKPYPGSLQQDCAAALHMAGQAHGWFVQ